MRTHRFHPIAATKCSSTLKMGFVMRACLLILSTVALSRVCEPQKSPYLCLAAHFIDLWLIACSVGWLFIKTSLIKKVILNKKAAESSQLYD